MVYIIPTSLAEHLGRKINSFFETGEVNIAESLIKKFKNYYGVQKIHIIEPHFLKIAWSSNYPIIALSAFNLMPEILFNQYY